MGGLIVVVVKLREGREKKEVKHGEGGMEWILMIGDSHYCHLRERWTADIGGKSLV